jgi:hypothetical protein
MDTMYLGWSDAFFMDTRFYLLGTFAYGRPHKGEMKRMGNEMWRNEMRRLGAICVTIDRAKISCGQSIAQCAGPFNGLDKATAKTRDVCGCWTRHAGQ